MKYCTAFKYSMIAAVSLLLLAGCDQLPNPEKAAQAEEMRKNGNALIENGKPQEAIIVFDKLIALEPENALAYNGKAVAFDYSGNHLAAQEIYETALALAPDSIPIKNNLAMSLILNHQVKQAIALLEPLVKNSSNREPSINVVRHNLALAYGISGQHEKATRLNLRDLTKEQAQENIRYYESYVERNTETIKNGKKTSKKIIDQNEHNIGFIKPQNHYEKPVPAVDTKAKKPEKPKALDSKQPTFFGKPAVYEYPE